MTIGINRDRRRAAARLAGVALSGVLAAGCSLTTFEDPSGSSGFLGVGDPMEAIGLSPRQPRDIEYNPRSPLVMPPAPELRDPKPASDPTATVAWPNDPDAAIRAQERAIAEYNYERQRRATYAREASRPMTQEELERWARDAGIRVTTEDRVMATAEQRPLTREELDRGISREELIATGVEPPRRSLTEPPTGARVPAPEADGTIAPPEPKKSWFSRTFGL